MLEVKLPREKLRPMRLKAVHVSILSLLRLLREDLKQPSIIRSVITSKEVPVDAHLISVHLDPYQLHTIVLVLESEEFLELGPGDRVPELRVHFQSEPAKDDLVVQYLKDGWTLPDPDDAIPQDPSYWSNKVKFFRGLFLKEEDK